MKQGKKRVSFVLLFSLATLLLFGWVGSAYAQEYQIVTLTSTPEPVAQGGTVDITFTYNTSDSRDDLTGFGAMFCFDSSALTYQSYTGINAENLYSLPAIKVYDDTNDQCGFGATGKKIPLVYKEKDGVKFTSVGLPADLMKFTFQAANTDTTTTVKSIGTIAAAGYEIQDGSATITIGAAAPVLTSMDIPTAVLAIEATDPLTTVVDASAADYENERIAGAITAAAVPAALDTPILVYCRAVENAQAQAQALVDAGYTSVAYLDAPFADFAADTTNVTDAMVQYKLTVTTSGGAGTVTPTEGFYNRNEEVTIIADPAAESWSANAPDGVVTMTGIQTVTATFAGAVNTPPVADAASFTVVVGGQLSGTLTGSDADPGDTITFIQVSDPAQGTLSLNADGSFIYDNPTTAGTDSFTFKVNDGTEDSAPATVTITVEPNTCDAIAAFTAAATDLTATFDAAASVGTLSFDYGDGSPAGSATTHTYASAGTYTVTLTATGTGGCTETATQDVTLIQGPCDAVASLTIVSTNDLQVTLDTPNAVGDLMFDYGDGTTGQGYSHTYTAAGTYTITVTATGTAGCTDTATQDVTVNIGGVTPDGDGNGDGYVDIYDALAAAMYDVTLLTEAEIVRFAHLDVDQNGVVDINDALAIAKYDVGLICTCVLDQ